MSTEKRVFQILDEMNQADIANSTGTVGICNQQVSATKTKNGGHITMGVPAEIFYDIVFNDTKQIVLLVIDKAAFEKTKVQPQEQESEWKVECERLAKVAEYWQNKWNEANPGWQPSRIDNL